MGLEDIAQEIYGADGRKGIEYVFIRVLKIPLDSMYHTSREQIEGCMFAAEKHDVMNWISRTKKGTRDCINLIDFIGNCRELREHYRRNKRWFGPYIDEMEIIDDPRIHSNK
jgi:hypothetical protein